ncbi:MAG: peptidoglycan-binding protein [Coriobacteriia bacterium]|nr:peptidoglycan-binding protein [Coriobacteriia bacterium]
MKPIKVGDSGRGVEDIQRRLATLGYDFPTHGIDGDFRDETHAAVEAFQRSHDLEPTGEVDMRTWSKLVDSTFVFGDRSLYLRAPFFHGQDVLTLQRALNSLGFPCGELDSIFGPHTERAVIEFQENVEIGSDGVVGAETYEHLRGLRHIWDSRTAQVHSAATIATQQRERALYAHRWQFIATCPPSRQIVRRLENLALASCTDAQITIAYNTDDGAIFDGITVIIACADEDSEGSADTSTDAMIPYLPNRADLAAALIFAEMPIIIAVAHEHLDTSDKLCYQYVAHVILDALCAVFE